MSIPKIAVITDGRLTALKRALTFADVMGIERPRLKIYSFRKTEEVSIQASEGVEIINLDAKSFTPWRTLLSDEGFFKCDVCLLFVHKLVPGEVYSVLPTINFHPSALPNFPGLTGLEVAWENRHLAFSAHFVDHSVDGGDLLFQVVISKLCKGISEAEFRVQSSLLCSGTILSALMLLFPNYFNPPSMHKFHEANSVEAFLHSLGIKSDQCLHR